MNQNGNLQAASPLDQLRQYQNVGNSQAACSSSVPSPPKNLTAEQLEFEAEFVRWENSFAQWKDKFANHPDQDAYRTYEKKFLDIRDKLLLKREKIYKTETRVFEDVTVIKLEENSQPPPHNLSAPCSTPLVNVPSPPQLTSESATPQLPFCPALDLSNDTKTQLPISREELDDSYGLKKLEVNEQQLKPPEGSLNKQNTNKPNPINDKNEWKKMQIIKKLLEEAKQNLNPPLSRQDEDEYISLKKQQNHKTFTLYERKFMELIRLVLSKRSKFIAAAQAKRKAALGETEFAELNKVRRKLKKDKGYLKMNETEKEKYVALFRKFDLAQKLECPPVAQGTNSKRFKIMKRKAPEKQTAYEKKEIQYITFVQTKRYNYFAKLKSKESAEKLAISTEKVIKQAVGLEAQDVEMAVVPGETKETLEVVPKPPAEVAAEPTITQC